MQEVIETQIVDQALATAKASLDLYRDDHAEVGGFLTAVLRNDLFDAVVRADPGMLASLKEILLYCHWELPSGCWHSPEAVNRWLKERADVSEPV